MGDSKIMNKYCANKLGVIIPAIQIVNADITDVWMNRNNAPII